MEHLVTVPKKSMDSIIMGKKRAECVLVEDSEEHPFNSVKKNDVIFFQPRGGLASVRARVNKVEQHNNLCNDDMKNLFNKYRSILPRTEATLDLNKKKVHAMLVHFDNLIDVKPFTVNKAALNIVKNSRWITVPTFFDISKDLIRK